MLLPQNHPFLLFIREYKIKWENFQDDWEDHELQDQPGKRPAKGVLHLQHMSLRCSKYFRDQATSDLDVETPSTTELIDEIELKRPWAPILSSTFQQATCLDTFCRIGGGSDGKHGTVDTMEDINMLETENARLRALLSQLSHRDAEGPMGGDGSNGGSAGGGGSGNKRLVDNEKFNEVLFGELKKRKVNGKFVPTGVIKAKIKKGELPALPNSRVDGQPMCLAWHTKGICNSDCPRAADHVTYNASQYQPMKAWCDTNYPKDD